MGRQPRETSGDTVVRAEFSVANPDYPFVGVSTIDGCRTVLERMIPRGGNAFAEFFSITGVDASHVLEAAADHESVTPTVLLEHESGGLFEFRVDDDCPAIFLCERGALPRRVSSADGRGTIVAEIPSSIDAPAVVEEFLEAHPSAELLAKADQSGVSPLMSTRQYRHLLGERLTDRQEEVLVAAFEAGYYEWPRESTADELATTLGISTPTLLKHLRSVERKFVQLFFERPEPAVDRPSSRRKP